MAEHSQPAIATLRIEFPERDGLIHVSPELSSHGDDGNVCQSPGEPRWIHLPAGVTVSVGRARRNHIVLENPNVSRFHAVISTSSSGAVVSDLGSTNGTYVNDARITTPVDLATGDLVRIGPTLAQVEVALSNQDVGGSILAMTRTDAIRAVVVTVLVVDIQGYTSLSQQLPQQDIAEMLNQWFQLGAAVVKRHGGEVDKYIGDCVMALWHSSVEDAAGQARKSARAAREIISQTQQLAESGVWPHQQTHPWRCRASLNSGEAMMGSFGGAGSRDFTVLGDTVNVAFRLDSVGSRVGVRTVVSESTANYLGDHFPLKKLGSFDLKGRTGDVVVYSFADI